MNPNKVLQVWFKNVSQSTIALILPQSEAVKYANMFRQSPPNKIEGETADGVYFCISTDQIAALLIMPLPQQPQQQGGSPYPSLRPPSYLGLSGNN